MRWYNQKRNQQCIGKIQRHPAGLEQEALFSGADLLLIKAPPGAVTATGDRDVSGGCWRCARRYNSQGAFRPAARKMNQTETEMKDCTIVHPEMDSKLLCNWGNVNALQPLSCPP